MLRLIALGGGIQVFDIDAWLELRSVEERNVCRWKESYRWSQYNPFIKDEMNSLKEQIIYAKRNRAECIKFKNVLIGLINISTMMQKILPVICKIADIISYYCLHLTSLRCLIHLHIISLILIPWSLAAAAVMRLAVPHITYSLRNVVLYCRTLHI
jgi:hypothetical protein